MENFEIPVVHPIQEGNYVTVPSASWNALCETVNKIIEAVNLQSCKTETNVDAIRQNTEDISKIGKILEGIYATLE